MINPSLDIWVWVTSLVLLGVLGARAWVVETGQGKLGRTPVQVQVLTGAAVVVILALVGLLAMQGGILLVESLLTGTDPSEVLYGPDPGGDPAADPAAPADQAPVDPAAPAVPPAGGQPPAGQPPAGQPPAGP